ncbi:hypothetical protein PR202_gb25824 [Eleusine coracana subsp. coracana]|uniref:Uncharacterized protein n=1 Tax=Eleusine coracana subsp. coracana TaxID=191504 RepID=A0AAV5FPV1_ELECO|nr:hypothetical protein PR202_gb25788 [Eleusine coracana subsp. coracana]GJN36921.1 hypothetical protein PR202_gb25824 [Eleusine coracana subsp. coracana]
MGLLRRCKKLLFHHAAEESTREEIEQMAAWWTDETSRPSREEFVQFTAPIAHMLMDAADDDPEKVKLCQLLDRLTKQWKSGAPPSADSWNKRGCTTAAAAIESAAASGGDLSRLSRDEFLSIAAPLAEKLRHADDNDPETMALWQLLHGIITQWRPGRRARARKMTR